jgi:hypothetical protein
MSSGITSFYKQSIPRLVDKLHEEAKGSTVHILERDVVEVGGVRFAGCTLGALWLPTS